MAWVYWVAVATSKTVSVPGFPNQAVNAANAAKDAIIAQKDQAVAQLTADKNKLTGDIQQGATGLTDIQNLLNTPQGQRKVSTSYSGQLGSQLNAIIKSLLPPGQAKK